MININNITDVEAAVPISFDLTLINKSTIFNPGSDIQNIINYVADKESFIGMPFELSITPITLNDVRRFGINLSGKPIPGYHCVSMWDISTNISFELWFKQALEYIKGLCQEFNQPHTFVILLSSDGYTSVKV